MLETYLKWFQSHERLLLVAVITLAGFYGWTHYVDKTAETDKVKAGVAEQIAQAQKDSNAYVTVQVAAMRDAFEKQQQMRDQEIANLVSAIAQRDAVTKQKIDTVKQITTAPESIQALVNAYPSLPAVMTATADGADVPVSDLNTFTATKIERDSLAANNIAKDSIIEQGDQSYAGLSGVRDGLVYQVDGLKVEIAKNAAACEAEKKSLKADARKSKWKTFWLGFLFGVGARSAVKY